MKLEVSEGQISLQPYLFKSRFDKIKLIFALQSFEINLGNGFLHRLLPFLIWISMIPAVILQGDPNATTFGLYGAILK